MEHPALHATPACTPNHTRLGDLWLGALLVLLPLVAYYPMIHGPYSWDDYTHLVDHPYLQDAAGLLKLLDPRAVVHGTSYAPFTMFCFWLERHFFGTADPTPFHVVSVVLHAANAVLLWRVLRRLGLPWAPLAGALFAVHPLQVETVAWITEQKNLLAVLFALLAGRSYLIFDDLENSPPPVRWKYYAWFQVCFLLSLLSKPVMCTLPVTLLLAIYWRRRGLRWRDILPLVPALLLAGALGLVFWRVELRINLVWSNLMFSPVQRILIAGRALCFYGGKFFWPLGLLPIYPLWHTAADWNPCGQCWEYLYPVGVGTVLLVLWVLRKACIAPLLIVLFCIVTLSPVLGFVSFPYMGMSLVADHLTYAAMIGAVAAVAGLLPWLCRRDQLDAWLRRPGFTQAACAMPLLLLLGWRTWNQACLYKDQATLWQYAIDHNPHSWVVHANMAGVYGKAGKLPEALHEANLSLAASPNSTAYYMKGLALARLGQLPQAATALAAAIAIDANPVLPYVELGRVRAQLGDNAGAVAAYQGALQRQPWRVREWTSMAVCQLRLEQWDKAAAAARAALAYQENYAPAHCNLAAALRHLGDLPGTIAHYRRGVELDPGLVAARLQLGDALAVTGDWAAAAAQYRQVLAAAPDAAAVKARLAEAQRRLNRPAP